jgi:ATP-dependent Clp protease ATP-binding subunit ClpA
MSAKQNRFTPDAHRILSYATDMALQRHSPYIDVEHVLLGVLQIIDIDPLRQVLTSVDRQSLSQQLSADLGIIRDVPLEKTTGLTVAVKSCPASRQHGAYFRQRWTYFAGDVSG